jgi:signal transduction histidine kinase
MQLDMEPDLSDVYAQLIATLRELLPCDGAAILIPRGSGFAIPAQFGPHPLPSTIDLSPAANPLLERLSHSGQPILMQRDEPFQPPLPAPAAASAWLGAPILAGTQLFGFVSVAGALTTANTHLAGVITQQAAQTLRWATRWSVVQHQSHQLYDLDRQIRHQPDQAAALTLLAEASLALTGATHCCIFANKQGRATMLARRGYTTEETALIQQIPPSLEHGLTGQAFRQRIVTGSDDIADDPTALPALAQTRAQLVVPIYSGDKSLGIIDLQSPQPGAFRGADTSLLLALGNLAAATIEQQQARQAAHQDGHGEPVSDHDLLLSSRLAVVTDLAAGVAHEINNPLTTILGYTHLLLRDQSLPDATRADISQIMVEGQRIATLVERFLRFAQPSSSGKRPLSVNEPLIEALGLLKNRLHEGGVQVTLDLPSEPAMVLGQAGQLEQAFVELLQNAIEAMSTSDVRRLSIQVSQQSGWARIAIGDTGRGIRPDLLTRVFEPGFTTKVDKGISRGLGLGLYAVHTIAQDHWGRVEVQSQVWQGSTFTVCLPAI